LIALLIHLTEAIISACYIIPPGLAVTAFTVEFLSALSEAGATSIWRRELTARHAVQIKSDS